MPWELHDGASVKCLANFSGSYDPAFFDEASIPGEFDSGWASAATPHFTRDSALCAPGGVGEICACHGGADFTYAQTFVDLDASAVGKPFRVEIGFANDAARVTVFNSAHSSGVDATAPVHFGGTLDLSALMAAGRNRIVITVLDDCCTSNSLDATRVVASGTPLLACP